jgi:hypothetical protein
VTDCCHTWRSTSTRDSSSVTKRHLVQLGDAQYSSEKRKLHGSLFPYLRTLESSVMAEGEEQIVEEPVRTDTLFFSPQSIFSMRCSTNFSISQTCSSRPPFLEQS